MNENATKARIKSKTGIDCVIAWLEPRDEDDFHRKVKVSAVRQHPPVGSGFWDVTIELDDEKLGDMSIYREGSTYARKICQALVAAVGGQATHAARNRKNRKARRDVEREAVIAETAARKNGAERAMNDVMLECEALKVLERSQSPVSTDALGNEMSFRLERHITKDEFGFMMCKLERLGLVSRSNTALMREVWAITDKGRQALKEEMGR